MTTTLHPVRIFLALAALAAAVAAPAQIITEFKTIPDYTGSDITFANGRALTQTFAEVRYIQSMTYRFIRTSGASATNLNWYFVEWNAATNMATAEISSGTISIPAISGFSAFDYPDPETADPVDYFGYDYLFQLDYAADASKTYAMVLVGTVGSTTLRLGLVDAVDKFPYGAAYRTDGVTSFTNLATTAGTGYAPIGSDWGFAQITVELAAIPEPTTAAAAVGALLVAGLIALRLHRRRQEQLALVPVTTK